ncbi:(R,R)-butanediol dehydrogenase/meso-butanediol dehydrogenase/diacetyl reductase/hypothetical protein [Actinocorallia herbida]|uniref:Enoyl reductase (ER) domain-containing protein n=1 Tax=Actinocorallia herbida TaxID=58109 RepID=A0A3N1D315_9ACTN|nr:2,3-butanediol dehydrogenase [Actinocorallia herbida]ROO87923.1 (R,R)-butanediol dehydrogenase/meso-butanediol dehydrogenase/diacetyl reductase/hypothetical protein [Actinocorallia herbida]
MRALRLHGPRDLRLEEVPDRDLRPGTVRVRIEWAGICGSDLHFYEEPPYPPEYAHPVTAETGPHVIGHEFSGVVTECAPDVTGVSPGMPVVVEPTLFDGTCAACLRGETNLCENAGFIGINGWGGGMSENVVVPAHRVHVLPEGVTTEAAALIEPLAVAWHAVRRSGLRPGETVAVIGAGPIGLGVLMAAKAQGAGLAIVSEPNPARRAAAQAQGADVVVDPLSDDLLAITRYVTNSAGVDASFESSGAGKPALDGLLGVLRKGGRSVLVAPHRPLEFNPGTLLFESSMTGSMAYRGDDFPQVIAAIADGRLRPEALISDRIPLERAVTDGFEALLGAPDQHVKILVQPGKTA